MLVQRPLRLVKVVWPGCSWENSDSWAWQEEKEEDDYSVEVYYEFIHHFSTVSRLRLGCERIWDEPRALPDSLKMQWNTQERRCHCLLPTFRAHPVTHLLTFTFRRKMRRTLHSSPRPRGTIPSPSWSRKNSITFHSQRALFLYCQAWLSSETHRKNSLWQSVFSAVTEWFENTNARKSQEVLPIHF